MGPATAVLVLPTLQWVDTARVPVEIFNGTALEDYPRGNSLFPGCTAADLENGNYTCTYDVYGPSLDKWANSAVSARQQMQYNNGDMLVGSSQEGILDFTLNFTKNHELFWVPNRQVLGRLSIDTYLLKYEANRIHNNSLQTLLQRQGPSLGMQAHCFVGNFTWHEISDNRYLRCYTGWTSGLTEYTKCFRVGGGWNFYSTSGSFNLIDVESNTTSTTIWSSFADKAIMYNADRDFGSGIASCLDRADCDWDDVFDTSMPPDFRNTTINVGITEYRDVRRSDNLVVWCESVAYLGFPTYTYDTSLSNFRGLVQLNNLTEVDKLSKAQIVSPFWLLAAWSAPVNGIVDDRRPMARAIERLLPALLGPWDYPEATYDQTEFYYHHAYALGQSLSMVNYYSDNATAPDGSVTPDMDHPVLSHYATIRVWAYGLNSRTSRLGVAVVFAGCGCVLFRLILGFVMRAHNQSSVEMFVAALEHQPTGEFRGLVQERQWAKVRYQLDESVHGKPIFFPAKG